MYTIGLYAFQSVFLLLYIVIAVILSLILVRETSIMYIILICIFIFISLKGLAQAKIIKKSVILFRVLNMTI